MSTVKVLNCQIGQSLTATNNFCWYQPSSPDGTVRLGNGNAGSVTDLVTVNSSGNVGIGTSSPAGRLDVRGASASSYIIDTTGGSAVSSALYLGVPSITTYAGLVTDYANDRLYIRHNSATRATFDSSGNLGLGVTPSYRLDCAAGSTGAKMFRFTSTGANKYMYGYCDGGGTGITNSDPYTSGVMYYQSGSQHQFYTGSTQAMTLDASGNLLVGTTSTPNASTPGQGILKGATGTYIYNSCSVTSAYGHYTFWNPNGAVGSISTNGSATAYNTSSDQRLKENIVEAQSALNSVIAIKVRSFNWKADGSHVDYGYIAQELLEVAPEAVSVPADPEEMMGVDFGRLTPRLVKAIQELSAELNELKGKIA